MNTIVLKLVRYTCVDIMYGVRVYAACI